MFEYYLFQRHLIIYQYDCYYFISRFIISFLILVYFCFYLFFSTFLHYFLLINYNIRMQEKNLSNSSTYSLCSIKILLLISIQETNYNNILIFMIPIPICLKSRQLCFSVCIYQECQLFPFICSHCEYHQCQSIHIHHGKQVTKNWSEIALLVQKYRYHKCTSLDHPKTHHKQKIDQYDETNQYIINCLQNKQYSKIVGKSMRALHVSMIDYTKTQIQEHLFQQKYHQIQQVKQVEQDFTNTLEAQDCYFRQGQKMIKQKKYQSAIDLFEKVIQINKNNYKAYRNLMETIKEIKKQEQFIQKYVKQLQQCPNNSTAYVKRGLLYQIQQKYEDSIINYDKAIQLDANYSIAYNLRANVKCELNYNEQALIDYQKAIELNPKYSEAYYGRGLFYYQLNEIQKALNDYNKAIELDESYTEVYYNNRALLFWNKKQWQLTIKDQTKAIEINPNYCDAYNCRGIIYKQRNEIQKALSDFNKIIELDPLYYGAYYNRAIVYTQQKQYAAALHDYSKVIQLDNYLNAYYNRALVYQQLNQLQMAIKDMNKVLQLNQSPQYLFKIGQLYFKLQKHQLAKTYLSKCIQLVGECHMCYYYLCRIEIIKKNLQLSLAQIQKSIQQQIKSQYALYKGIVLDLMQEEDLANENYEMVFEHGQQKLASLKSIYKEIRKFKCETA